MVDVGGKVPGSMPFDARSIWEEGLRIPPVRIYDKGVLNKGVLDIMLNNTRTPDMNRVRPDGAHRRLPHRVVAGARNVRPLRSRRLYGGLRPAARRARARR